MAAVGLREYFTYHGLIWCLLVLFIRETASTCDVKFADGLGKNDKRIFVLGERAELKCDVTAMDPTQDVLYWKYDEKVFSENNLVMPLYRKKYNVSLGPENGKKIYTLSFKVEADDVGKYNCTCGSGGIQYPVWVKVPCNEKQHITKDEKVTSKEIIDILDGKKKIIELECGNPRTLKMGWDCKCTWPEVDRVFEVKLNETEAIPLPADTETSCPVTPRPGLPNATQYGNQDSKVKPLSCYTGVGSVTFRYKDVIGSIEIPFTCNHTTMGKTYDIYMDEGQEEITPNSFHISIHCPLCNVTVCEDTDYSATTYICIIVGSIIGVCGLCLIVAIILIKCLPSVPDKKDEPQQKTQNQTLVNPDKKQPIPWEKTRIIVSIVVIIVGVGCLCALIIQTVRDKECDIDWSRKCACARCEYDLLPGDIARAVVVSFVILCVTIGASVYLCKTKPLTKVSPQTTSQQNQTNYPKTILQKQANPQPNQANYPEKIPQKQVNLNLNPTQVTLTSEEDINSSRKKHNVLKERGVKKDDTGRSGDDQDSTIPNGFPVPVSGSTAGQLSEMTPEKHPPPKLDPIITVPEGGEALTDENTDTPRKRKKKRRKKHRNKVSPEGGADADAGDSLAPDPRSRESMGGDDADVDSYTTFQTPPLVVERNEVFVPVVDLDHANHNETSDMYL